jgi:hypothetical protein
MGFPCETMQKRGPLTEEYTFVPRVAMGRVAVSRSPADLILSPGDFGFQTRQVSQNVSKQSSQALLYRLVFPIAFETENGRVGCILIA